MFYNNISVTKIYFLKYFLLPCFHSRKAFCKLSVSCSACRKMLLEFPISVKMAHYLNPHNFSMIAHNVVLYLQYPISTHNTLYLACHAMLVPDLQISSVLMLISHDKFTFKSS